MLTRGDASSPRGTGGRAMVQRWGGPQGALLHRRHGTRQIPTSSSKDLTLAPNRICIKPKPFLFSQ